MKYIKGILVSSILSLSIFSCVEKDEISQWNLLHDVEDRTQALEDLCYNLNNNILSIEKLLEAQTEGITINGVQENTDGYSIFFSDGTVASIYNGKDGQNGINGVNGKDGVDGKDGINGTDGKDGVDGKDGINGTDGKDGVDGKDGINGTDGKDGVDGKDGINGTDGKDGIDGKDGYVPQISVTKVDDTYYWTLDGEIMLDNEGNKVIAQSAKGQNGADGKDGKDGITPKLRIEKDFWEISYDNGTTWTQLAKAIGANGTNGTDGKPGITPKLEIKDGFWYVSYDNGTTFEKLGKATGEDAQKPQFKIEDGILYQSYDGKTWESIGEISNNNDFGTPSFKIENGKLIVSYDGGKTWEEVEGGDFAGNKVINNDPSKSGNGIWFNHEYVDLGLPSGNKWATVNIGATQIYENGACFAFGETKWKLEYSESTYLKQYGVECRFSYPSHYGYGEDCDPLKAYIDTSKSIAGTQYDAATANWGEGWTIPLRSDFQELLDECPWAETTINGIKGFKITSAQPGNTNWIFLPYVTGAAEKAGALPSNHYSTAECAPNYKDVQSGRYDYTGNYVFNLGSKTPFYSRYRFYGFPIRPVCKPNK